MTDKNIFRVHLLVLISCLAPGCAVVDNEATTTLDPLSQMSEISTPRNDPKARADLSVATGRLAEENGDTSQAMKLYSEAVALDPKNADAHWRQAILFSGLQRIDEATQAFERAVALKQSDAELYTDYGYHLYLQDRLAEAEDALRTAIRLNSGEQRAHNNLGLVLAASGREQDAIASFLDAGCSEADAKSNLAFVQALGNDLTRARSTYQQALALDPSLSNSSNALNQLNKLVVATGKSEVIPAAYPMPE